MPRSLDDILAHADELADRFEEGPDPADDLSVARAHLHADVVNIADAERQLVSHLALARGEGMSWEAIADVLGMSREAARRRYGQRIAPG